MVSRLFRFEHLRIFRLLGRRGLLLIFMGGLWTVFGLTLILTPNAPHRFTQANSPAPILGLLDESAIGWLWIVAGCMALFTALFRMRRHGNDAWGFNALLAPAIVWSIGYIWSIALWATTGLYGRPTSASGATVWLIVCTFIMLLAGWPDPDDPAIRRDGES